MSFQPLQKQQTMAGVIQFYEGQNIFVTGALSHKFGDNFCSVLCREDTPGVHQWGELQ